MRKWLAWTVLFLFVGSIAFSAFAAIGQNVTVQLLFPWLELNEVSLGVVMFVFALNGAIAVCLLALLDRVKLTATIRTLKQKVNTLDAEVKTLRQLTAGHESE